MAELLIRVVDKVNEQDQERDAQCMKRGDVVVIVDDGWKWSPAERKNPDWRIVSMPGIPAEKLQAYLAPEKYESPAEIGVRLLRRRAFKIDMDALVAVDSKVDAVLADTERAVDVVSIAVSEKVATDDLKASKAKLNIADVILPIDEQPIDVLKP